MSETHELAKRIGRQKLGIRNAKDAAQHIAATAMLMSAEEWKAAIQDKASRQHLSPKVRAYFEMQLVLSGFIAREFEATRDSMNPDEAMEGMIESLRRV